MHFDGVGNAIRDTNWQSDAANGIPISSSEMDLEFNGIATCLTDCMTRDGQGAATANMNMGTHQINALQAGTNLTDAATLTQAQLAIVGRNFLMNPSFRIWQRNGFTGVATLAGTAAGLYGPDRWFARRDGVDAAYTLTQVQSIGPARAALKVSRDAGSATTSDITVAQSLDVEDAIAIIRSSTVASAGNRRAIAVSCALRKGANISTATGIEISLYGNPTGGSNALTAAGWVLVTSTTILPGNLDTVTFTKCALLSAVAPAVGTYAALAVRFRMVTPVGVAGADDSFTVSACKLEMIEEGISYNETGSAYVEPDYATELLKCQRYYWKSFPENTAVAQNAGTAGAIAYRVQIASTAAGGLAQIQLPTPMRQGATPTITTYNPSAANANWRNDAAADSGIPVTAASSNRHIEITNPQVAGDAAGNTVRIHVTANNEY